MIPNPETKTIAYIEQRIDVELPDQIERAKEALGRITMKHYGQLSLFKEIE